MLRFRIKVYSHGLKIKTFFQSDKEIMRKYYDKLSTYDERFVPGRGRVRTVKATYATYHGKTQSYGLHRNELQAVLDHMKRQGIGEKEIEVVMMPGYQPAEAHIVIKAGVAPREHQPPLIEFLMKPEPTRVLPLQTGKGKTFCGLFTAAQMGVRTSICMSAMHIKTWCDDMDWMYEGGHKENARIIKGGPALKKIIKEAKEGKLCDNILIFSVGTIRNYITEYEKNGKSGFGVDPSELYELLGVGLRITDEAHENLHFQFRHDIETHVLKSIYLSATLESRDSFVNRLYETIYPIKDRYLDLEWDKYIDVTALGYGLKEPTKVKYKAYGGRYNHIVYEEWLMKDSNRLLNYFKMIQRIAEVKFFAKYQPRMKLFLYFASKEMCDKAAEYFSDVYTQYTCSAYTSDYDEEILYTHDIICTTLGSAGTGKDIKGLATVIMTNALLARERNIQVLGRLRELHNMFPDVTPEFIYLVCRDIDKHMQYHRDKAELFQSYAKSVNANNTSFMV